MILVIGGAGYIGSHVNMQLTENGYDTVVYDNLSTGHREFVKWGKFIEGDVADTEKLRQVFDQHDISAVMHFAAFTFVGESVTDPLKFYQNNFVNTTGLLSVMKDAGVGNFVFSSTCACYGMPEYLPLDETHPLNPINPYGRTKFFVEKMLADFDHAYDLKYVSLRYFNAAGADPNGRVGEWHEPESHLIPLVLDAAIGKRENIQVFGDDYQTEDGTCIRDYIHVLDLADAHIMALEHLAKGGESKVYNLGNGKGFSVREVIDAAGHVTGKVIPHQVAPRRPGDPGTLVGSYQKINTELGWQPKYTTIQGIIETAWNWHQGMFG